MTPHIPITQLAAALKAEGWTPPGYRRLYTAAASNEFPAERGANGRWTVARDDLSVIAESMKCKRIVDDETPRLSLADLEAGALVLRSLGVPVCLPSEMETVSYHLPIELIELYRDLAEERLLVERSEKRKARRNGETPPQARRSASAIVREAMEAYRPQVEAELMSLRARNGSV